MFVISRINSRAQWLTRYIANKAESGFQSFVQLIYTAEAFASAFRND